jgi:hypothetical protein
MNHWIFFLVAVIVCSLRHNACTKVCSVWEESVAERSKCCGAQLCTPAILFSACFITRTFTATSPATTAAPPAATGQQQAPTARGEQSRARRGVLPDWAHAIFGNALRQHSFLLSVLTGRSLTVSRRPRTCRCPSWMQWSRCVSFFLCQCVGIAVLVPETPVKEKRQPTSSLQQKRLNCYVEMMNWGLHLRFSITPGSMPFRNTGVLHPHGAQLFPSLVRLHFVKRVCVSLVLWSLKFHNQGMTHMHAVYTIQAQPNKTKQSKPFLHV